MLWLVRIKFEPCLKFLPVHRLEKFGWCSPPTTAKLQLKNKAGTVLATNEGTSSRSVTKALTAGSYTLSVTPLTGSGDATLTSSYPGRPAKEVIKYDGNDHPVEIDDGTHTIKETLSPSGRVLRRTVTDDATGEVVEDVIFGYDSDSDSPAYSRPYTGGAVTTYIQGPSGLLVLDKAGAASYPITNGHGDIVGTTDSSGTFTAYPVADEFGVGEVAADRLGWLGSKERFFTGGNLRLIRMGVRLYDPRLGRFLQVDPVEGGSCNDYDYVCADPVNEFDLDGEVCWSCMAKTAGRFLWKYKWDILLTAASFALPAAGAAVWAYRAYRLTRLAQTGVQAARATRATGWLAGRMWVGRGGVKDVARNGAKMYYKGTGAAQRAWRGPAKKGSWGNSSNLTRSVKGRHDHTNFHINHGRWL